MGRWAEVYFTSAPEKREEAVLELLRELQGEPSSSSTSPPIAPSPPDRQEQPRRVLVPLDQTQRPQDDHYPAPAPSVFTAPANDPEPKWMVCEGCGGRNIVGNRFCGMCGAPLPPAERSATEKDEFGRPESESEPSSIHVQNVIYDEPARPAVHPEELNSTRSFSGWQRANSSERQPSPKPLVLPANEWPDRPALPSLFPENNEPPSRKRMYIGAVVGILILGLIYVAWKGSANQTGKALPEAAPASSEAQSPLPDQSPAPVAHMDEKLPTSGASAPSQHLAVPAATKTPRRNITAAENNQQDRGTARTPAPAQTEDQTAVSQQAAQPVVASLQGNGSEELTVAENYLNGTHGRSRDSSEAAKWLWRSFGKKNGAAAILLSDLYVRGDGVPKSCDQARVLLDTAARKGTAGAAERLRNLPSVGCQ